MTRLRRHLRAWAMAWCLVQAAALASLLPVGCCAAHEPAAAAEAPCHETPRATQCPMRGAGGKSCPMHAGHADSGQPALHAGHDAHATPDAPASAPRRACAIRSACDGPTVFTLFSHAGLVPAAAVAPAPPLLDTRPMAVAVDPALTRSRTPDPRPPRA
jgi:hypothetical protein